MSTIILQLLTVFLLFDGVTENTADPTFLDYICTAFITTRAGHPDAVECNVWYDARADRPSEYYAESLSPAVGEVLFGCIFAVDSSGNRSACVAPAYLERAPDLTSSSPSTTDVGVEPIDPPTLEPSTADPMAPSRDPVSPQSPSMRDKKK